MRVPPGRKREFDREEVVERASKLPFARRVKIPTMYIPRNPPPSSAQISFHISNIEVISRRAMKNAIPVPTTPATRDETRMTTSCCLSSIFGKALDTKSRFTIVAMLFILLEIVDMDAAKSAAMISPLAAPGSLCTMYSGTT